MKRQKRKVGAPDGNQNARKHGFYSKTFTPEQQQLLSLASDINGLSHEITALRVKIASILASDPANIGALTVAVSSLARLLRTDQRLGTRQDRARVVAGQIVSRLFSSNNHA